MIRRDLHGLAVDVEDRLPGTPSRALLAGLPGAGPGAPAALRIRLVPAAARAAAPAGTPVFFHGAIRAFARDGAVALWDGASVLAVAPGGGAVDGEVHPDSLADPHAFAHALLLMAVLVALRHHGLYHLHAAALRAGGGAGILVAGDGGSGKSTVALAFAAAGHGFLGDDAVLLARRLGRPGILSLPRAFHVAEPTARAFPALAPFLGADYAGTGKRLLDAERAFGRPPIPAVGAPAVLLFPAIGRGEATGIAPVSAADALGRLVEASGFLAVDGVPGAEAQLGLLRDVVDGARAFALELGRDLLDDPRAWAARLAGVTGN